MGGSIDLPLRLCQEQFTQQAEQKAAAAGVAPIRVDLPIRGCLFRFERILALEEPLWIAFDYSGWNRN